MFLIDSLLAAPGNGLAFLFKELARKAQEEWLDDDSLKQELQEMYKLFEAGGISEREFEEKECRIVERLQQIARAKYHQKWGVAMPEAEIAAGIEIQPLVDTLPSEPQPPSIEVLPPVVAAAPMELFPASTPAALLPAPAPVETPPATPMPPTPPVQRAEPNLPTPSLAMPSIPAAAAPAVKLTLNQAIDSALRGISLLNLKVSSITSVVRAEAGWLVTAELVERRSVPDTSDLLGLYELRLDEAGNVLQWERTRMRRRCDLGR